MCKISKASTNFLTKKLKILTLWFTKFDFILIYQFPAFSTETPNAKHILEIKTVS